MTFNDVESLQIELESFGVSLSKDALGFANCKCVEWGIEVERRIRRRRMVPSELTRDARLSAEETRPD